VSRPPRILVIAGSDSSGGAGIQADIKTVTMLGGYAMTAITAVTAQNTRRVEAVETMAPDFVAAQIDACLEDIGADAIKIGMLGSADVAEVVADRLEDLGKPIVFDPVMVATSGAALADAATIEVFGWLMEIATLTTPNVPELAALGGRGALEEMEIAFLAKGGDTEGAEVTDVLVRPGQPDRIWSAARIDTRHTHGTGCTLSSAIATRLAQGHSLEQAIEDAREFVRAALAAAPGFGRGTGPLGQQAVRRD
jgi:hydroxymethylpyrimidine/phosphomethylpyrimidine kinase